MRRISLIGGQVHATFGDFCVAMYRRRVRGFHRQVFNLAVRLSRSMILHAGFSNYLVGSLVVRCPGR